MIRSLSLLILVVLFSACVSTQHEEREKPVFVDLPKKESKLKTQPKQEKTSGIIDEEWRRIQNTIAAKKFSESDILVEFPEVLGVRTQMTSKDKAPSYEEMKRVGRKLEEFELNTAFLERKIHRTKDLISDANLSEPIKRDYEERMTAIPRLLEENRLEIVHDVLNDIQKELIEMIEKKQLS